MKLRIKEVANRNNTSLSELAKKINIDKTTLSRYNTGTVIPPLNKLQLIADFFKCEVSELLHTGVDFAHFYDEKGEWQGIRKK